MKSPMAKLMCIFLAGFGSGCTGNSDLRDQPADARGDPNAGPNLPADATRWVSVGEFTLRDKHQVVDVRVYAADSDIIGAYVYPNVLTLHIYFRAGSAPWKEAEPWSAVRVGWVGVGKVTPEEVELLFRAKVRVEFQNGKLIPDPPPPHSQTLMLDKGVPVIKK
jgi:hypothetical protein